MARRASLESSYSAEMAERRRATAQASSSQGRRDAAPEPPSAVQRAALGKETRTRVPLEAHADYRPARGRDPVALLLGQAKTRVPDLVPIRHGRMLVSPFTFYRGAALVMAADLHTTPTTSLRTQLCGDAHLSNFGAYASPERRLVFDINDFDESLPGPFEWDVKRLATSFVVAGRDNGLSRKQCRKVTLAAVERYRSAMRAFATQPILDVWYARLDIEDAIAEYRSTLSSRRLKKYRADRKATDAMLAKAHTRDSLHAIAKLTSLTSGRRRIISNPPLIVPLDELTGVDKDNVAGRLHALLRTYRNTLQSDRRHLLEQFRLTDVAQKVVGVGSVGTRAWILLLESDTEEGALLLQSKQAEASALADYAGASKYGNQGERVVAGQHLMQATSDIFLGWLRTKPTDGSDKDYYVRQLRDWKLSAVIEEMNPRSMNVYAQLCGWTLARGHARAGDRIAISSYLGPSTAFDNAIADFAETYADQNQRDHSTFAEAVAAGTVEAQTGI